MNRHLSMNLDNRGFTAAEIITVVAIIAILSLIAIPKFWSHTEEARISRAKEEMARIADAEAYAYAQAGQYFHLGNLVGNERLGFNIVTTWDFYNWRDNGKNIDPEVGTGFVINTVQNWKGPYLTFQRSELLEESSYWPLDPWKQRYIFYGPVTLTSLSSETEAGSKIRVWSAGPNLRFDSTTSMPWGPAQGDDILYER